MGSVVGGAHPLIAGVEEDNPALVFRAHWDNHRAPPARCFVQAAPLRRTRLGDAGRD